MSATPSPARSAEARPGARHADVVSPRSPWMVVAALVAAACVALSVSYRIYDPDIWENLVVGKAIWQLRQVPTTQLWSWPTYGAPDVKWTWGFSALIWPVWERGGVWGLFAWRWGTALLAFGLLWAAARRMGAKGFTPLVVMVVCSLVWRARSQVRPETLAAVLLALELWILETRRQGGKDRAWWLTGVAWAWANVHNTWFLGLLLIGIFWLHDVTVGRGAAGSRGVRTKPGGARRREAGEPVQAEGGARGAGPLDGRWRLQWVGLAALAISFVNPYGWRALWQPFDFFLHHRNEVIFSTIGELGPIDWGVHWKTWLPLLVVGWPLLVLARARRSRIDLVEAAVCLVFTLLALRAQRFLGFYALAAAPYVSRDLAEWLAASAPGALGEDAEPRVPRTARASTGAPPAPGPSRPPAGARRAGEEIPGSRARFPPAARAALAALACVAAGLPEWTRRELPLGVGFLWSEYPVAACDFMEAHGVRGRGFNQFGFAGYQLYRFWPDRTRLPFMDIHQSGTRTDRDLYAWAQQRADRWQELDRRYEFDYALLGRTFYQRNAPLDMLDADSTWALVFLDDVMALYVRRSGPLAAVAREFAYLHLPGGAIRLRSLGEACARDSLLRARTAEELERVVAGSPRHGQALILLSNIALREDRIADARRLIERSLATQRELAGAHYRLALIALHEGRPRQALDEVARERSLGESGAELDVVAGRAWRALGDRRRAMAAFRRAASRDSSNTEARDSLAALARADRS